MSTKISNEVQLDLPAPVNGVQHINFKGVSNSSDINMFHSAITGHLKAQAQVRKIVFDLSKIDLVFNAAGRILDLACFYHQQRKIPIDVRMPREIYDDILEIELGDAARTARKHVLYRGVNLVAVEPLAAPDVDVLPTWQERLQFPATVQTCAGKVTAIDDNIVTVVLFIEEEKIIGEFMRGQFSSPDVQPGMVFDYVARNTQQGTTEITLNFLTVQRPTNEELMDDAEAVKKEYRIDTDRI